MGRELKPFWHFMWCLVLYSVMVLTAYVCFKMSVYTWVENVPRQHCTLIWNQPEWRVLSVFWHWFLWLITRSARSFQFIWFQIQVNGSCYAFLHKVKLSVLDIFIDSIIQGLRDLRSSLVKLLLKAGWALESGEIFLGLYAVISWKPPRTESTWPPWATCATAWLSSGGRVSPHI